MTPGNRLRALAAAMGSSLRRSDQEACDLRGRDGALAAGRAVHTELAVAFPATEGLDTDAEGFGEAPLMR